MSKENIDFRNLIMISMFFIGNVCKDVIWFVEDFLYVCCGFYYRDCLGNEFFLYLKKCYISIFDDVDEEFIIGYFKRFVLCIFFGDKYGLSLLWGDRLLYIFVRWCVFGGKIDISGSDFRFGII